MSKKRAEIDNLDQLASDEIEVALDDEAAYSQYFDHIMMQERKALVKKVIIINN